LQKLIEAAWIVTPLHRYIVTAEETDSRQRKFATIRTVGGLIPHEPQRSLPAAFSLR
jgi:hypothetical protein